jgi:hypothetical protein
MHLCGNFPINLCSILFYIGSMISFSFQSNLVYLFCITGISIHAYWAVRTFLQKKGSSNAALDALNEPGLDEKVKIMDDLDREAQRRREVEQFTRN